MKNQTIPAKIAIPAAMPRPIPIPAGPEKPDGGVDVGTSVWVRDPAEEPEVSGIGELVGVVDDVTSGGVDDVEVPVGVGVGDSNAELSTSHHVTKSCEISCASVAFCTAPV